VDRRTAARELTMQALYQLDIQGDDILGRLNLFFKENTEDDLVFKLASQWTKGAWDNLKTCDEAIASAAIKWQLDRLSRVDKSIIRLAVYQLTFCTDIPPKVVINEAIEMAKKYSAAQSPAFVNGVLDAILKKRES